MRWVMVSLALGLAACSNAAVEGDPWVGTYDAMRVTAVGDCATGIALPGSPSETQSMLELMRDADGALFMVALCPFTFEEPSAAHAELVPLECESELADGTPVFAMVTSGFLDVEGGHLTGEYETTTMIGTECVMAHTTVDATRL